MEEDQTTTQQTTTNEVDTDIDIAVLNAMNAVASAPTAPAVEKAKLNESPVRDVENSLGSFTQHTFEIIKDEYDFQKSIEAEIQARLQLEAKDGGFTAKELIALHTNNSVNLNDRISKVLGPTFTLMTEEVKAEIAARTAAEKQQQAQVNINLGNNASPDQMRGLNETVGNGNRDEAQSILQGAFAFQSFLQQLGVKTPQEALNAAQQVKKD